NHPKFLLQRELPHGALSARRQASGRRASPPAKNLRVQPALIGRPSFELDTGLFDEGFRLPIPELLVDGDLLRPALGIYRLDHLENYRVQAAQCVQGSFCVQTALSSAETFFLRPHMTHATTPKATAFTAPPIQVSHLDSSLRRGGPLPSLCYFSWR